MYDILSCYLVLLSFRRLYVVEGPCGDVRCKLAKAINSVVFRFAYTY